MDDLIFWQIIEETHDVSMEKQKQKLYDRLKLLSEDEIIAFERLSTLRFLDLYSWELWGVAYLYGGGCSDDGFSDWRNWIVYCGKSAFETARDRPDDLVPLIEAHPAAGCEGIGYVAMEVLSDKNPKWKDASPDFDIPFPDKPRGKRWEEDDLKELLPKTYKRFEADATEEEQVMRDPDYLRETFGLTSGEEKVFTLDSTDIVVDGHKASRTRLVPAKKKAWWKFWQRDPMD